MKRSVLLIAMLVVFVGTATQVHAIGLFGAWQNASDLDSGFGIGVTNPVGLGLIRIDPRASWYSYSDSDVNVFPLDCAAELDLGIFYGGLGASYYIIDSDISNRWGFFAIAGVKLKLTKITLFGDLIWRGSDTLDSIDFSGGGLNVGIIFF
jgi:hypothetical protein